VRLQSSYEGTPLWITSNGRRNPGRTRALVKLIVRRSLIGLVCGSVSSLFLFSVVRSVGLGLTLGALLGIAQIFAFFDLEGGSTIDRAMTCAALGLPFWAAINVILLPMAPAPPTQTTQVVILGGGFAGVTTAKHLEKQFRDDPTVAFTLVSETNFWLFTPMIAENAREFKTLSDAIRIRNHVIDVFECADAEPNPDSRRALLTFVVAGGGFSGAELAGGLNDLARGITADYASLSTADLRIILVHSGERIYPS
jgi:hypothetical protein